MTEIVDIEDLLHKKLNQLEDFSDVLTDELCYTARLNGLAHFVNRDIVKSPNPFLLLGKLCSIESLAEFYRLSISGETKDRDHIINLMNKLGLLYKIIMK